MQDKSYNIEMNKTDNQHGQKTMILDQSGFDQFDN